MAHINLLPWRDELRKERQRNFVIILVGSLLTMGLLVAGAHFFVEAVIDQQNNRNQRLKKEIASVEKVIKEIEALEKRKDDLLKRMEVIQNLQASRPLIVHVFDAMVETIPVGVYLQKVIHKGSLISIDGVAESNSRVSTYMRNIKASEWMSSPDLKKIGNLLPGGRNAPKPTAGSVLKAFKLTARQFELKKKPK